MANKITLDTITSSFASTSLFNTNFAAIKSELDDKVLYRNNPTGEANQMLNDLDMNSNDILNASTVNADIVKINGVQITPTGTTTLPALAVSYDNSTSGLTANSTQAAIDEVDSDLDTAQADIITAQADITAIETQQAQGQNYGKNLFINGDFSIWQRGTSQTTSGFGSDDRWNNINGGTTKVASQQTFTLGQTDVPGNPKYYSRTVVTSVAGAGNYCTKSQNMEDVTKSSGRQVTLSFYAKADAAKNIATEFVQIFGTGGSPSSTVLNIPPATHALTTSWQRFTMTTTLPSVAGKTLGTNNNSSLGLNFWLDAGSDFDARTNSLGQQSGTFDIANIQLEFGDTATEFEYVSPADQLARCKRYFERIQGMVGDESTLNVGFSFDTTNIATPFQYTEKRDTPSVTLNGTLSALDKTATAVTINTSINYQDITTKGARIVGARSSGTHTQGDIFITRLSSGTANSIDIDAEL